MAEVAYFKSVKGPDKGTCWILEHPVEQLGRAEDCSIRFGDENVSRHHANLFLLQPELVTLEDLGSSNGTYVNSLPVSRIVLLEGDLVRLGETELVFREGHPTSEDLPESPLVRGDEKGLKGEKAAGATALYEIPEPAASLEALKNAYLQLKTLHMVVRDLAEMASASEAYRVVGEALLLGSGVERAALFRWKGREEEEPEVLWEGIARDKRKKLSATPLRWGPAREAYLKNAPLFFGELSEEGPSKSRTSWRLAVPIAHKNEVWGALLAENPLSQQKLGKNDLDFAVTLAQHLGNLQPRLSREQSLAPAVEAYRSELRDTTAIITHNPKMRELVRQTHQLALTDSTVLITGESGTGKELFARSLHVCSRRNDKPFVAVNCAALTETLLESELFGHEKGAFTGADRRRIGKFEQADGGTIFLDEVGDISPAAQAKLLRVLQDGEVQRVGGNQTLKVDVRVVAATNHDLTSLISKGKFREDLYYRLKVVELEIPPLRERPEDIPLISGYFLQQFRHKFAFTARGISSETARFLVEYSWPGNVRELRNVIERALVFCSEAEILPQHLPREVREEPQRKSEAEAPTEPLRDAGPPISLAELERRHIRRVLAYCQGNKLKAAGFLGISRSTLYEKIKEYELDKDEE
ncbi:MAG: sigma 54-interacting transcriptional regulator [bacterium]